MSPRDTLNYDPLGLVAAMDEEQERSEAPKRDGQAAFDAWVARCERESKPMRAAAQEAIAAQQALPDDEAEDNLARIIGKYGGQ